jgi:tRNA A58 N-methylase Trm61
MNDNTQCFATQILEHLHAWCGLVPAWTIADTGAGTGMLSEIFLENGNRVFTLEPNGSA